jgi:segregation and condensation protein A
MSYQVKIDIFEGPFDLLLHLIQKNDLDIYDIPISDITSEYLKYIDLFKEMNLTLAGDFLVMAATLIQIKAKTLLPRDEHAEEGPDPREELVARLVEYQKFKEVSDILARKYDEQRDVFYRGAPLFNKDDQTLDLNLPKLLDAFRDVLESSEVNVREILVEEIPVEVRIRQILDILETRSYIRFSELFPAGSSRYTMVVSFLALLELIRLHQVQVSQPANFDEIHINRIQNADKESVLAITSTAEGANG